MPAFEVTLQSSEPVAESTMAFHLDKPEGFRFKPGQSIDLTLIDPTAGDQQGKSHTFSLVSAPFENRLTVATRMRERFQTRAEGAPRRSRGEDQWPLWLHDTR